jgi:hypothetical protein
MHAAVMQLYHEEHSVCIVVNELNCMTHTHTLQLPPPYTLGNGLDGWWYENKHFVRDESVLISSYYKVYVKTVPVFRRLNKNGEVFFCQKYARVKRRNSYTITYTPTQYGQIVYFTLLMNKAAAIVKKIQLTLKLTPTPFYLFI